jgi:2'-5' RNA ligase
MPGVIALLDPASTARVESLWDEMEQRFGVARGFPGAIPHVTFHLSSYDVEPGATAVVERVAAETAPFTLYSSGPGLFGGPSPILFANVARAPAAASLAARLDAELTAAGYPGTDTYYTPERWIPHITLAQQNLASADLGALLAWLARQPLAWELPIASLSIARETPTSAEILATFPLPQR